MNALVTPQSPSVDKRRTIIWALVVVLAWLAFALWAGSGIVFAPTDTAGLMGQALLLWIAASFTLYRALMLVLMLVAMELPAGWLRRLIEPGLGIVAGFVVTGWTVDAMIARHDRLILQHFLPLVSVLEAGRDDLQISDPRFARSLTAWRGESGFLISVTGASLDIDGSTVFYDSETGVLMRFHNDRVDHPDALRFAHRTRELTRIFPRR